MAADAPPSLSVQLVEEPRLLKLKKMFVSKFKSTPKFYARAPGRVNLIGEHIDYCGYAVLPMAIEQDICIAAEPLTTPVIHLANTNPLYADFSTNANNIQINQTKPLWHNYFLCGFKGIEWAISICWGLVPGAPADTKIHGCSGPIIYNGVVKWWPLYKMENSKVWFLEFYRPLNIFEPWLVESMDAEPVDMEGWLYYSLYYPGEQSRNVYHFTLALHDHFSLDNPSGINCLIEGTIPPSSGLSSSSALVCCAGLVTLMANGKTLPKVELAELCSKSERYIGTQGGGMDQSICFLAEKGTAKLIEFNPLRATDVKLPEGVAFVIANSCVEMNKAATSHFNIRVMECRLATKLLAKFRDLDWKASGKLQDIQIKLGLSLEEMLDLVEEVFHPEPYSIEEIGEHLGISPKELRTEILSQNTQDVTTFKLYQRAKHVYSEAARVMAFKKICMEAPDDAVCSLGDLMNQSHASCRDLYECSCPELDQLVDICLQSGAVGSRLTGAGWGGCTVSMVPVDRLERFLANVKEAYYAKGDHRLAMEESSLFATSPGGGAMVFLEA